MLSVCEKYWICSIVIDPNCIFDYAIGRIRSQNKRKGKNLQCHVALFYAKTLQQNNSWRLTAIESFIWEPNIVSQYNELHLIDSFNVSKWNRKKIPNWKQILVEKKPNKCKSPNINCECWLPRIKTIISMNLIWNSIFMLNVVFR